jgi:predicted metal-dependent hydrolase
MRYRPPSPPDPVVVAPILLPDGTAIPVTLRVSARAQRVGLRVGPATGVELVVPKGASIPRALAFLDQRRGWVAEKLRALPPRIAFTDGAEIPVLGMVRRLRAIGPGQGRRPVFLLTGTEIQVTGAAEHLARRTRAGLGDLARHLFAVKSARLAAVIGRKPGRIMIGDAKSRWGSCAASGDLRFSWRLVLAPEPVVDYVAAHEVAHLVEMNHGPDFWRLVERLHPGHADPRAWLKGHGAELQRYG